MNRRLSIKPLIALILIIPILGCVSVGSENRKEIEGSNAPVKLRMMTYNILEGGRARESKDWHNGLQTSPENRVPLLIDFIRKSDPDIVFLQECNGWADDDRKILKEVSSALGMHGIIAPNHGPYLVAMLSKFPIVSYSYLPDDDIFYWNILSADIALPGDWEIKVASTHYGWWGQQRWWAPDITKEEKLKLYTAQTEFLMSFLDRHKDIPFIIAGDFNHPDQYHAELLKDNGFHADIPNRLIKQFYPRIFEMGYSDIYWKLNKDYQGKRSCLSKKNGVIDHFLATSAIADNFTRCEIVETDQVYQISDHLPIYADIVIP